MQVMIRCTVRPDGVEADLKLLSRDGDEVIDAEGGTVLPGLFDSHIHLVPGALAQGLAFGVTTALDMFSLAGVMAAVRRQAGARPDVADVRSAGIGATAPGGHPSMMYAWFPTLTGPEEAGQFVADRVAESSDYLPRRRPRRPSAAAAGDAAGRVNYPAPRARSP